MFRKRTWEIIDKQILPSPWEQMTAAKIVPKSCQGDIDEYFHKSVIVTYRCKETGEEKVERV